MPCNQKDPDQIAYSILARHNLSALTMIFSSWGFPFRLEKVLPSWIRARCPPVHNQNLLISSFNWLKQSSPLLINVNWKCLLFSQTLCTSRKGPEEMYEKDAKKSVLSHFAGKLDDEGADEMLANMKLAAPREAALVELLSGWAKRGRQSSPEPQAWPQNPRSPPLLLSQQGLLYPCFQLMLSK